MSAMLLRGQARYLHENINSFLALVFISSYLLAIGLVLWHAFYNTNPLADVLAQYMVANSLY